MVSEPAVAILAIALGVGGRGGGGEEGGREGCVGGVRFLLTIDPSVSTLHSTSLSRTLHLIFMTRALQMF